MCVTGPFAPGPAASSRAERAFVTPHSLPRLKTKQGNLMTRNRLFSVSALAFGCVGMLGAFDDSQIGKEVAIPAHLRNGDEYTLSTRELIKFGKELFMARWTSQEGAGRPLTKGTGNPLSDPLSPLVFPRNFNRISGPDTNSCAGCHNLPDIGGGGDVVGNVFVLGQRFDFTTFNATDTLNTKGEMDERGCRSRFRQRPIPARPLACLALVLLKC